jgi:hypothetical protein
VIGYLDALADRAAQLPTYFPPNLRQAVGNPFDAIRQMVQVVEDRSGWDQWRAEERERARAAGIADDRLAYAPGRARPEDREEGGRRDDRPAPPPLVPWDEQAAARFPRAVILGDPGFGKTWLLRYEARRLARDAARALRPGAGGLDQVTLPLFARLSDLNRSDGPLEDALAPGQSESFRRFACQRLEAGDAVVLLDAWDEVPVEIPEPGQPIAYASHYRQRLGQRLGDFARRFPRCRVLLTSRIVGYNGSPIPGARELELFAFDGPQVEAFAGAWFGDAELFLASLRQSPQVGELARIPLMLTLLCRAFAERRRRAPAAEDRDDALTRRASVYRVCLRGLLRDWREEKERREISDGYVDAMLEVLSGSAHALFAGGYEQFGEGLLRERVRAALGGLGAAHELAGWDATSVIAELKRAGLLITTGEHRDAPLMFLHRTFQEYLAARDLARRVKSGGWGSVTALVDRKAWRPAWQEVLVLLAGQLEDPVPLLRLLANKERDDLFRHRLALAALCLTEVRAEALDRLVLGRITTDVVTVLVAHRRKEIEAAVAHLERALSALGQANGGPAAAALDRLLDMDRDEHGPGSGTVVWALWDLGPAAAPALDRLLELTRDVDKSVRAGAARSLGKLGPAAAPALDRLLDLTWDADGDVREAAAKALGALGTSAPALDRLLELIRDGDDDMRVAAARALGGLAPAAAPVLDRLLELTRDADDDVREAAARALGGLAPAAAPALDRLLMLARDGYYFVQQAAAEELGRLSATDLRVFRVPVWKRFFFGSYITHRIEELDPPESPAAS